MALSCIESLVQGDRWLEKERLHSLHPPFPAKRIYDLNPVHHNVNNKSMQDKQNEDFPYVDKYPLPLGKSISIV